MLRTPSLAGPDLGDRRTRLALGTAVMGGLIAALIYTIGTGDVRLTMLVGGLAVTPALLVLALKRSYLFPYGLYVVLVPFDNMLKISGTGTLTKMLGIASTFFIIVYAIRRKGLTRPPLSLYLALAYLGWTMISVLWTPDASEAMIDVQQTVSLVLMYAVLAVAPVEERDVRAICACIVFGGIAASFYGMYLLHQSPVAGGEYGRLMINVDQRTIDPNHFANSMLAPLALSFVALLNARRPGILLFSAFSIVVIASGILMSLSREALLASAVVVVVVTAFSKRRFLAAAIGVPLLVAIPLLIPTVGARMAEAMATGGAGRTSIWSVGLLSWRAHPFLGWGAGGALEAYDRNYLRVYQFYNAGWGRPPHNTPLHAAIELGLVGLAIMCIAYFATFRQFRSIPRGDALYDLRVAFTASLIALGVCSLFIDLANYKYLWIVITTIAQIRTVTYLRRRTQQPAAEPVPVEPVRVARPIRRSVPLRT